MFLFPFPPVLSIISSNPLPRLELGQEISTPTFRPPKAGLMLWWSHYILLHCSQQQFSLLENIAMPAIKLRMFGYFLEHFLDEQLIFVQQLYWTRKCNYLIIFTSAAAMRKFQFLKNIFQFFWHSFALHSHCFLFTYNKHFRSFDFFIIIVYIYTLANTSL